MTIDQNNKISEAASREQSRLRNFVRRRVTNPEDVEDVVQDVFFELVDSFRLMRPVEHIGPWLFRVARNRIIDLYRSRRRELSANASVEIDEEGSEVELQELLASPEPDPEAAYEKEEMFDELESALRELPKEQREVFVAHVIDGRSFAELSAETGVNVNTLLARKRYAVLRLRERLQGLYQKIIEG